MFKGNIKKLARTLILDELFDLVLYQKLLPRVKDQELKGVLQELIAVEKKHFAFWKDFFKKEIGEKEIKLNFGRTIKLFFFITLSRIFGGGVVHIILEAIEVYGIRKYIAVWKRYKNTSLGKAVESILHDELSHEAAIVSRFSKRKIFPERVRDIFLGFNDGLVEVVGAITGFFVAFQTLTSVLIGGFLVAIAGAISMAAGAYVALSSEREVEHLKREKQKFLGAPVEEVGLGTPFGSAIVVGISYIIGAFVPLIPIFLGAKHIVPSILVAGATIILVSSVLAFLSGMAMRRRILINFVILTIAVAVTYGIGIMIKSIWGISL